MSTSLSAVESELEKEQQLRSAAASEASEKAARLAQIEGSSAITYNPHTPYPEASRGNACPHGFIWKPKSVLFFR